MIKAILFDIDGVLVDSSEANISFKRMLFEKAGYTDFDKELQNSFHKPIRQVIEEVLASKNVYSDKEAQRIFDLALDPSIREVDKFKFPPDLVKILDNLHKKYTLGIVTSRIRHGVNEIFNLQPIKKYFDVVISFDDVDNYKPHPEPLEKAIFKLNLQPDEAIYIGDSDTDIVAAHAIGMPSIHLTDARHENAYHQITDFSEVLEGVDFIIDSYADNNS